MSRYTRRSQAINDYELYDDLFRKRNVKKIKQYRTAQFMNVTDDVIKSIDAAEHTWTLGDSFASLAFKSYGDPRMWWVIAGFNRKPTESHVEIGDVIRIPVNLAEALQVVS